jgi:hypothetical protein
MADNPSFIHRHPIDPALVQRWYDDAEARLPAQIEAARGDINQLGEMVQRAIQAANCAAELGHEPQAVFDFLQIACGGNTAIFAAATPGQLPITVFLDGTDVEYQTAPSAELVRADRWLNGFFLAVLCRDVESQQLLERVTPEMLRGGASERPEYEYRFAEAVLAVFAGDKKGAADKVIAAMEATDPERIPSPQVPAALSLGVPLISAFWSALAKTAKKSFQEALTFAIVRHKEYWADEGLGEKAYEGFLSIPLLGVAALAYDQDVPFEVDSDYVPQSLVRGDGLEFCDENEE